MFYYMELCFKINTDNNKHQSLFVGKQAENQGIRVQ